MHELSIAEGIVRIASEHAAERRVTRVEVKVGYLRQVVPTALSFAFDLVALDTPVEGAELVIHHIPARLSCRACGAETLAMKFPFACRRCGSVDAEVHGGDELLVDTLELADVPLAAGRS